MHVCTEMARHLKCFSKLTPKGAEKMGREQPAAGMQRRRQREGWRYRDDNVKEAKVVCNLQPQATPLAPTTS